MSESLLTDSQKELMREAHKKLKTAFPKHNLGIQFNLCAKPAPMNYNIKISGIDNERQT